MQTSHYQKAFSIFNPGQQVVFQLINRQTLDKIYYQNTLVCCVCRDLKLNEAQLFADDGEQSGRVHPGLRCRFRLGPVWEVHHDFRGFHRTISECGDFLNTQHRNTYHLSTTPHTKDSGPGSLGGTGLVTVWESVCATYSAYCSPRVKNDGLNPTKNTTLRSLLSCDRQM